MVDLEHALHSGYTDVDQSGNPLKYIARLDENRTSCLWRTVKLATFDLLAPGEGESILDVGCGTGDDVLALAERVGPKGRVVGVDSSAQMIGEARRRAAAADLPVYFYRGDARRLAFRGQVFHGCRVERVLQHLHRPEEVLAEMIGAARSGARIVAVEPDYGTLLIEGADPTISRRITLCRCEHFLSPHVGRQLPGLFRQLGLSKISLRMIIVESTDLQQDRSWLWDKYVRRARLTETLTASECARWLAQLESAAARGRYRHRVTLFIVGGHKR